MTFSLPFTSLDLKVPNDDEGDCCHDNIGGVLLINNNAMRMMMMLIRAVIEISSCQANDTSRREIQQLGILFGSIFLLFSNKGRWGSPS